MRGFAIMFGLIGLAVTGAASAYCSKPSAPYCASRYGAFDDEDEFRRCKREMEDYQNQMNDFLSCTRSEADRAVREYNDAVETFNRRARG